MRAIRSLLDAKSLGIYCTNVLHGGLLMSVVMYQYERKKIDRGLGLYTDNLRGLFGVGKNNVELIG